MPLEATRAGLHVWPVALVALHVLHEARVVLVPP